MPHEITIYDGQPHAFVRDAEGIKSGGAPSEAWDQMLVFLEKNLKNNSTLYNSFALADYRAPYV